MSQVRRVARCRQKHQQHSKECEECQDRFFCFTNGKLVVGWLNCEARYAFEVPNDEEGAKFIELAKKFLNERTYTIKLRGRHSDRMGTLGNKYRKHTQNDIPIAKAEWYAFYLNAKKGDDNGQ